MRSVVFGILVLLSRPGEVHARDVDAQSRVAQGRASDPIVAEESQHDMRDVDAAFVQRLRLFQGRLEHSLDGDGDGKLTQRNCVRTVARTSENGVTKRRRADSQAIEQILESRARPLYARNQDVLGCDAVKSMRSGGVHRSGYQFTRPIVLRRLEHGADRTGRPNASAPSHEATS